MFSLWAQYDASHILWTPAVFERFSLRFRTHGPIAGTSVGQDSTARVRSIEMGRNDLDWRVMELSRCVGEHTMCWHAAVTVLSWYAKVITAVFMFLQCLKIISQSSYIYIYGTPPNKKTMFTSLLLVLAIFCVYFGLPFDPWFFWGYHIYIYIYLFCART